MNCVATERQADGRTDRAEETAAAAALPERTGRRLRRLRGGEGGEAESERQRRQKKVSSLHSRFIAAERKSKPDSSSVYDGPPPAPRNAQLQGDLVSRSQT